MQYEVTINFDIPCTRDGVLAVNPSEVLSYIRDEIHCGRGNMHPDDGIQGVKFRCSRVRKVEPEPRTRESSRPILRAFPPRQRP